MAVAVAVAVAAAMASAVPLFATLQPPGTPTLLMEGIAEKPCGSGQVFPVPVGMRASYYAGSSVLHLSSTHLHTASRAALTSSATPRCVRAAVEASRRWLRSGLVPGKGRQRRQMAARALLDLRLSVRPDGAVIAGWHSGWKYAWPRDSSWVAAALAVTGHLGDAFRVLAFLQRVQPRSGVWAARYHPGGGGPVSDGRPDELDADGWVPWAVWTWSVAVHARTDTRARRRLAQLWPMVARAADAAARSLTKNNLPVKTMDYWEDSVTVTLGTAAPLLAGLRAASDIAVQLGHETEARLWVKAADRLLSGIAFGFARYGYQRLPFSRSAAGAAVAFLGPPFSAGSAGIRRAAASAQRLLREPNGGLRPGADWPGAPGVAWTAETAFFALFDAATGQHALACDLLSWLARHRTRLGELPEQVSPGGRAISVAPLSWTDAAVLLALVAQERQLPTIRWTTSLRGIGSQTW